ncbi:MAG: hypothetical protein ABW194_01445 [Novosphingobium sp.]
MTAAGANPHALHAGIAEQGKLLALRGDHRAALTRYREALRLAATARAPQIVARHYLYCILESLERMGDHRAMAELAGNAAGAASEAPDSPFLRRDRAALLERVAVARLKAGAIEDGRAALREALALAGAEALPLAAQLAGWLDRGFAIDPARLAEAQRRAGYWVVRPDTVDPARALTIDPPSPGQRTREHAHG